MKHLLLFIYFSTIFGTAAAQAQTAPANLRNTPLNFDLEEARKLLQERGLTTTSPWFQNPNNYSIGLGHAHAGVIWGNYSVSFSSDSALTLTTIQKEHSRRAGDTLVKVSALRWDEKKNKYVGQGTYYGRAFHHCPLRPIPADIEMNIFRNHPFQGAWSSIEINYDSNVIRERDCATIGMRPAIKRAQRTITTVETIRALEQVSSIWHKHVDSYRRHYEQQKSRSQAFLIRARQDAVRLGTVEAKNKRDELIEAESRSSRILRRVDSIDALIDDTERLLKYGGRMLSRRTQEMIYIEKPVSLQGPPEVLKQYTAQALVEALVVQEAAQNFEAERIRERFRLQQTYGSDK